MELEFLHYFNTLYITNRYIPVPILLIQGRNSRAEEKNLWNEIGGEQSITVAERYSRVGKHMVGIYSEAEYSYNAINEALYSSATCRLIKIKFIEG